MAEQNIVTQSQLGPLKLALDQEAGSLNAHVSQSLSKSHGFEVYSGPNPDAFGNNTSKYYNSHGDVVGTTMLRLSVGGVPYYAPLIATGLSPQPPLTGITPNITPLVQPGSSNWITDYAVTLTSDALLVQSGLLIPHTQKFYEEAHGGIRAFPQVTLDSAGYVVGTDVIELFVNSQKVYIPATTRAGGPVQPPRITLNPVNASSYAPEGASQPPVGMSASAVGTMPMQFQWQLSYTPGDSTSWVDIELNHLYTSSITSNFGLQAITTNLPPSGTSATTGVRFDMTSVGAYEDNVIAFYIRCKFFTVYSTIEYASYTTYASIDMHNLTGSGCFLCTLAYRLGLVSAEIYEIDSRWARRNLPRPVYEGYMLWALPLSIWIQKRGNEHLLGLVMKLTLCWIDHIAYLSGAREKPNAVGWLMLKLGMPACYVIGKLRSFWKKVLPA